MIAEMYIQTRAPLRLPQRSALSGEAEAGIQK